jgi:hypothetical protein
MYTNKASGFLNSPIEHKRENDVEDFIWGGEILNSSTKKTLCGTYSVSEVYRPSGRHVSVKLVPNFPGRGVLHCQPNVLPTPLISIL